MTRSLAPQEARTQEKKIGYRETLKLRNLHIRVFSDICRFGLGTERKQIDRGKADAAHGLGAVEHRSLWC